MIRADMPSYIDSERNAVDMGKKAIDAGKDAEDWEDTFDCGDTV
jgi:hypothetical protein